jgi:hypothetical protein
MTGTPEDGKYVLSKCASERNLNFVENLCNIVLR